ncbi:MAG: response regulator [Chromatiales bacterium]|nr:response regulator [Chromatiales bacterium]
MDIVLPGINGFEACRRLKELEHTKNIPIIFTTSLNDEDNKIKGVEVEGDDYCIKLQLIQGNLKRKLVYYSKRNNI